MGWACWRQLSMSKVWYSLCGAHTFWLSMGLEGDLGMGLLALTSDVESLVFPMRSSHFLGFNGLPPAFRRRVPRPPLPNERINHGLSGAADRVDVEPLFF